VQGVTYRVELVVGSDKLEYAQAPAAPAPQPTGTLELRYLADEPLRADIFEREALGVGATIRGPAVIREALSTTVVMPGQVAEVGRLGEIVIEARP
jgi:N-methylhydantoinase A